MRYLYSSRALFVLYEAQLDNNALTHFKKFFHSLFLSLNLIKICLFSPCLIRLNLPVNFSSVTASVTKYELLFIQNISPILIG